MTEKEKLHAAQLLTSRVHLFGDFKFLPKIYVVNGDCYWFYLPALRAAYGTNHNIEVLTIEEALDICKPKAYKNRNQISYDFNQRGEDYSGFLFSDKTVKVRN